MPNRSVFPEGGIDSFIEHLDISPADIANVNRFKELKSKTSLTSKEQTELQNLTTLLRDKIFTPEDFNKLQDCITNLENFFLNETEGYIQTKQAEFQAEINKFTYRGIYNPSTQYYAKNYVTYNDGTGNNIFICIQDSLGNDPTNTTYWVKLGIKGEKGNDGVGLIFKGAWNSTTVYNVGDAVQYGGVIFGALQANTNQQPDLNQDTEYWAKAWDIAVTSTELIGTRNITTSVSNINFITGEITTFNPATDSLSVYKNSVRLTKGIDYVINADNQSIDKIGGTWDGTPASPILFEFVVKRNQINNLVFSDGQSIQDGTITKNKLSTDVQTTLDQVATNTGAIGILSNLATIIKNNLVNAINEVVGYIGNLGNLLTTAKDNLVNAINELKTAHDAHLAETAYYEYYYKNVVQSVPTGVLTDVTVQARTVFGGTDKNLAVIDANEIKILNPGMYFIIARLRYASNTTGYRQVNIASEGVMFQAISEDMDIFFARPYVINTANTKLTLQTYQNSGSALNVISGSIYVMKL